MELRKIDLNKIQDYAFTANEIAIRKAAISNSKFINIKCLDNESIIPTVQAISLAKIKQARELIVYPSGDEVEFTDYIKALNRTLKIIDNLITESEGVND